MADVTGRLWPAEIPFAGSVVDADTKLPLVRDGFVCDRRPGDFTFKDFDGEPTRDAAKVDTFEYVCPKTGKYCGAVMVGHQKKPDVSPSWSWDGNFEQPTLQPSINCTGGCGWHGWLTAGVFTG